MSPLEQFIKNITKRIEEMETELNHLRSIKERIEKEYRQNHK
ncbi:MAG: hypothetical protein AB1765_13405 [Candidatus Hydrogenedentota bacterium]